MSPILAFWESPIQLAVVGLIALLLFGKRLPEVMRSLGKGITQFNKGMNGLEEKCIVVRQQQQLEQPGGVQQQCLPAAAELP